MHISWNPKLMSLLQDSENQLHIIDYNSSLLIKDVIGCATALTPFIFWCWLGSGGNESLPQDRLRVLDYETKGNDNATAHITIAYWFNILFAEHVYPSESPN